MYSPAGGLVVIKAVINERHFNIPALQMFEHMLNRQRSGLPDRSAGSMGELWRVKISRNCHHTCQSNRPVIAKTRRKRAGLEVRS